jgi:hypothetical protein
MFTKHHKNILILIALILSERVRNKERERGREKFLSIFSHSLSHVVMMYFQKFSFENISLQNMCVREHFRGEMFSGNLNVQ